ncbi:MAG TPA: type 1 glutamine amidotransferase [Solirubrobacterales bacterium]|jgi:GMP synthase-like glutamine amidotransferase|nr:type 1 glutamine amidotransferase [Solirubrobacterales bacterium]
MERDARPGLVLQHGESGPPAILGDWLVGRGIEHEVHETWREPLPGAAADYGWVASLGSEHTPGANGALAWVEAEIEFLRSALELGVPVLGLCFGGQTLAVAAGGSVAPSEPPEIGWIGIETSDPELVPAGPWLHYHYDMLRPPADSEVLAWSPAGPAAFVLGPSLGLEFHPESTPEIAAAWARMDDAARLERLGIDPARLEDGAPGARDAAIRLFDAWWERVGFYRRDGMGTLSKIAEAELSSPSDPRRST